MLEADVLENNARREVLEETGVDLGGVPLLYLGSEPFSERRRASVVLTVTFVAEVPAGVEPGLAAPDELERRRLVDAGRAASATADCPPWTSPLLVAAADLRRPQPAMTRSRTVSGRSRSFATASSAETRPPTSVIT